MVQHSSHIIVSLLAFAFQSSERSFGQAGFAFCNYAPPGVNAPIFDAKGVGLVGTNYLVDVLIGSASDSLQPVYGWDSGKLLGPTPFSRTASGYFDGGGAVAPGMQPGELAWIQVRAWDARLAATYEEVKALGVGGYGESKLFQGRGTTVWFGFYPGTPLYDLESFSLLPVVPEPNVAWLVALGVPWLIYRHRRKPPRNGVVH